MTGRAPRLHSTDRGSGPVVLLVHGQPGRGSDWDQVAARLSTSNRVIVPDRPGYGRTGGPAMGLAANADCLGRLLDEKEVDSATVVGHSFGGGVALMLAQRARDRVTGLVVVGSVGTESSLGLSDRLLGLPIVGDGVALAGWELSRLLLPALRRRTTRLPPALGAWLRAVPEAPPDDGSRRGGATWRSFVIEQRALLVETPSLEAGLRSIRVPTAVVAGRRDRVVPAQAAADLAEAIPGAELLWVPEAGHLVPQEAPGELAGVVRRYASDR